MKIKIHVTLEELKKHFIEMSTDLPADTKPEDIVIDDLPKESSSFTWTPAPNGLDGLKYYGPEPIPCSKQPNNPNYYVGDITPNTQ